MEEVPLTFKIDCFELLQHVRNLHFLGDATTPFVPSLAMLQLPLGQTGCSTVKDQPKESETIEEITTDPITTNTEPVDTSILSEDTTTQLNPSVSPAQLLERRPSSSKGSVDWKIPRLGKYKANEAIAPSLAGKDKRLDPSRLLGVRRHRDMKTSSSQNEMELIVTPSPDTTVALSESKPTIPTIKTTASPCIHSPEEWYFLVASTPFSIAAQLVCADLSSIQENNHVIKPDPSHFPPMIIWQMASSLTPDIDDEILTTHCTLLIRDPSLFNTSTSSNPSDVKKARYDNLSQYDEEGKDDSNVIIYVAIVVGTNRGRVLSFQLQIVRPAYVVSKDITSPKTLGCYEIRLPSHTQKTYIEPLFNLGGFQEDIDSVNNNTAMDPLLNATPVTSPKRKRRNRLKPSGSVFSIQAYYFEPSPVPYLPHISTRKNIGTSSFVWITYTDGTMIRLCDSAFFEIHTTYKVPTTHNGITERIYVMRLPKSMNQIYIPCPRSFPTILSKPLYNTLEDDESFLLNESFAIDKDYDIIHRQEIFEAISFSKDTQGDSLHNLPTLSFYSSENQMSSDLLSMDETEKFTSTGYTNHEHVDALISMVKTTSSSIFGGTASLAKGVLGGFMGKFRLSTVSSGPASGMDTKNPGQMTNDEVMNQLDNSTHEERILSDSESYDPIPLEMQLTTYFYDIPRRITHLSIDPIGGTLSACADNLGRVQLIDLTTKQVIRLWKGCRDATCHWMTSRGNERNSTPLLYLLIHLRLRSVVEIYRVRHGHREKTVQVKTNDTQLVQCPALGIRNELSFKCFFFSPSNHSIEYMPINIPEAHVSMKSVAESSVSNAASASKLDAESSIQLRLLQQLLSSEIKSVISADPTSVLDAFKQITAVKDLTKAIDIIATASTLEDNMGIQGSTFHHFIISHAEKRIDQMKAIGAAMTTSNDLLSQLSLKVAIHKHIIDAYNVINKFEVEYHSNKSSDTSKNLTSDTEEDEAHRWVYTYECVTKKTLDGMLLVDDVIDKMKFSNFATCCLQSCRESKASEKESVPLKIRLCDGTKDRRKVLIHIFRPLFCDIFTMKRVREVFEHLGIYYDRKILLQYFGEWFMCINLHKVNVKDLLSEGSVVVRFLEAIIQEDIVDLMKGNIADLPSQLLCHLRFFCSKSEDLPRAFLLAQTCLNAITSSTKLIEEKTYGTVHQYSCVKPWTDLLSKLRICLLISLRMSYIPCTSFAITVDNIEDGTVFSIYEWIARDELRITHKQDELLCLEKICESIKESENHGKWKAMQQACMEENSKLSPLLYFLRHYNSKYFLAAHRALILSAMWGGVPENLDLLAESMHSIRILEAGKSHHKQLSLVVRAEIWNNLLRPLYRALFFGFDQVYEVSEDSISHLLTDHNWLHEVVRISLDLLKTLEKSDRRADSPNITEFSEQSRTTIDVWPPLQDDITLQGLSQKWKNSHFNTIAAHRGVVCSLHLSNDLDAIRSCFPHLENMFLSIWHMGTSPLSNATKGIIDDKRRQFVIQSLRLKAETSDLGLDEIIYLGTLFGLSKDFVFTTFVLCMYELEKDEEVDDLVAASGRLLNIPDFFNGCIDIISVRLSLILNILRREKRFRSILSSLDADTCQFVHESSAKSNIVRPMVHDSSIIRTLSLSHSLTLRMMRLSPSIRRGEIHSLSVLSATLLQAIQHSS